MSSPKDPGDIVFGCVAGYIAVMIGLGLCIQDWSGLWVAPVTIGVIVWLGGLAEKGRKR